MDCSEFEKFAEAYVDGEFDERYEVEIEAHLAHCPDCLARVDDLRVIRRLVRDSAPDIQAPTRLRAAVSKALDRSVPNRRISNALWLAAAAAATGLLLLFLPNPERETEGSPAGAVDFGAMPLIQTSVDWHRRNLPVEVTGPDTAVISQWFTDKVDFPVRLPDFSSGHEASLLGGRLSHVNNRNAAHVVYDVDGAKVSVMLFQSSNVRLPTRHPGSTAHTVFVGNHHGYSVALFEDNGVTYAITTAMSEPALYELVRDADIEE